MQRRFFLQGIGTVALSQALFGCAQNNQPTLNVRVLKGSIPGQVVSQFNNIEKNVQLKFTPVEQLSSIFKQLQASQQKKNAKNETGWRLPIPIPFGNSQKPVPADLVTLGDYWISTAIQQKLIQPLEKEQLEQWANLPKKWQVLVTRNDQGKIDPQGKVWGVPYRWGSTVLIYRRDKFEQLGWIPKDWADLWRSELRERISLLNHPREVIGVVLKKLGKSYNTENLDSVPNLEEQLLLLDQQVKFYSSERYIEPLLIGDTWLAQGWSNDIIPVLGRHSELAAVIPKSGTSLWADVWVSPVGKDRSSISYKWIDFCLTPDTARKIALITKTNSPISQIGESDIPQPLRNLFITDATVLDNSDFLLPLPPSVEEKYDNLFQKIHIS
jgi:putative spermidine/putrescine transport system substrate-binding protein